MDPRRFDAFIRAWTAGASRRRLLQALPALAVGSLLPNPVRAFDAGGALGCPTPTVGACTSGADCPAGLVCVDGVCAAIQMPAGGEQAAPTAVPAAPTAAAGAPAAAGGVGAQIGPTQVLPTRIYSGVCGQLGADPAFQLIDIGAVGAQGAATPTSEAPVGVPTAIPARYSTTVVQAMLADLVASDFAIDVRVDAADPNTSIVCGDVGGRLDGQVPGTELAIGLSERGNSGYTGVAWLRQEGERTVVYVFIAPGLAAGQTVAVAAGGPETAAETPAAAQAEPAETPGAEAPTAEPAATEATTAPGLAEGTTVVTSSDVNLRAAPSTDAAVIAILGSGVQLEVTGTPADGWVPVRDPATGRRGFVTADFLVLPQ